MDATFKTLEHTADIGVEVTASSEAELFEGAGLAMFSLMTDTSTVKPRMSLSVTLEAGDRVELLFRWLNELLYLSDTESMLFSSFEVRITTSAAGEVLEAEVGGEPIDERRHPALEEIKAATYHDMEVARFEDRWRARVIFDV